MADLRGLEHDVGQALALQLEHAQLEELVDQAADAAVELRLVGVEGHQDADAELAVHHHGRAEPDHQQVLHAEQQAVELLVEQLQLLRTQAGVDLFHQQAEPYRAALVLALEQLQRADAAHRLEEMALLARGVDDLLLGGVAQRPVPDPAAEGVEAHGGDGDGRQWRTVEQHHAEGGDGHQAVQHRREEGRGEVCWMLFTAPKRDTTSPRWRFSKYCAGSRSRWLKTLACHCTPSRVLMCIITQARTR